MNKPIVSVIGPDQKEKTRSVVALVTELTKLGYVVGTIKHHAHGDFDMDVPGKASYRHREAGASEVAVSGPTMLAYIRHHEAEAPLEEVAAMFSDSVDIIVTEGYMREDTYKVKTPVDEPATIAAEIRAMFFGSPDTGTDQGD